MINVPTVLYLCAKFQYFGEPQMLITGVQSPTAHVHKICDKTAIYLSIFFPQEIQPQNLFSIMPVNWLIMMIL